MNDSEHNYTGPESTEKAAPKDLHLVADELTILARMLSKHAKQDLERRLETHGITMSGLGYRVMRKLRRESLTLGELSRLFGISAASLLPVVDELEGKGYIVRGDDPNDRRRSPLAVTDAAKSVLALVPSVDAQDSLVKALHNLGEGKSDQLLELMRGLVAEVSGDPAKVAGIAARLASLTEQKTA
jgi:DNA-binding MarR family transcriptional regulator